MTDLTIKRFIFKSSNLNNYKSDYRLSLNLPDYLNDTLIGLLLSDGGLERSSETSNVRLNVSMSMHNFPYVFHLYNLFEPYIDNDINILDINLKDKNKLTKIYTTVRFKTISMLQLSYYFKIFYVKNSLTNKWKKIVPIELKSNFSPISLAHLIKGDGNYLKERNIVRIYTNSFIKNDVLLLFNILKRNLNICNKVIHDRNDQYIIIIEKGSINNLRDIVLPYMHPFMFYKLGIKSLILKEKQEKFDYFSIINKI